MNEMKFSIRNDANEINENLKKASVDSQVTSKEENKKLLPLKQRLQRMRKKKFLQGFTKR